MQLNDEQAKHAADTLRVVAIAQFGFFGYTEGLARKDWWFMGAAAIGFALIEFAAILILGDRDS